MAEWWKNNWEESRQHYLDWWDRKGLVISMWGHVEKEGSPHTPVAAPPPARDLDQFWFDPVWRSAYLHHEMSRSSFKADILPVANTHLGPGSLAAILGAEMDGRPDTIWYRHLPEDSDEIIFDENNRWWQLHLDLLRMCKEHAQGRYFVGCPDLIEGMDTLASLRGTQPVLMDIIDRPDELKRQIQAVNDVWFKVFDQIYDIINIDGEMAFCYFTIWGPGKVAKLQSDISIMISPRDFRRFVAPYIREQCQWLDHSLYHLDGVGAMRHVDALLEIEELDAIQWTPGVDQPQGGDPCWYDLYKRILAGGKSVMPSLVEVDELQPLLDAIGPHGVNVMLMFRTEQDIETAVKIADQYR
ncbi:MAG: hypothetical protein H6668_24860 [Ardenticatenaceae bacterium]|nr:hypothetical protein [Ardenticatenaceae bacterium]